MSSDDYNILESFLTVLYQLDVIDQQYRIFTSDALVWSGKFKVVGQLEESLFLVKIL